MVIILDTNILFQSPRLTHPSFIALFDLLLRNDDDSLFMPQIVIDEAINHSREILLNILETIRRQNSIYRNWTGEDLLLLQTDDKIHDIFNYKQYLQDTFQRVRATVYHYPNISHERLAARCLARKKPFSENGEKGYRDALLWASICEILLETSPEEVIFISNDTKDFLERNAEKLHSDLLEDLHQLGIDCTRIQVFKDLHKFVEIYVKPSMKKLDLESIHSNFSLGLGQYTTKEDIETAILQALTDYQYGDDISPRDFDLPSEAETIQITNVEDLSSLHLADAREMSSGEWLIEATATASYCFDFFVYKADWYILDMDEDSSLSAIDSNWNDHYVLVEACKKIEVKLSLTFNEQRGKVTSLEINDFHPLQPYS